MTSRISSKGQITVPADVRDKMGLLPGTVVEFTITPKGALLRKRVTPNHPIDRLYGMLKSPGRTDDRLDAMRGPRPSKG